MRPELRTRLEGVTDCFLPQPGEQENRQGEEGGEEEQARGGEGRGGEGEVKNRKGGWLERRTKMGG